MEGHKEVVGYYGTGSHAEWWEVKRSYTIDVQETYQVVTSTSVNTAVFWVVD
jgi:hypothetical protein